MVRLPLFGILIATLAVPVAAEGNLPPTQSVRLMREAEYLKPAADAK